MPTPEANDRVSRHVCRAVNTAQASGYLPCCAAGFHSLCDGHATDPAPCTCPATDKHVTAPPSQRPALRPFLYALSLVIACVSLTIGILAGLALHSAPLTIGGIGGMAASWWLREHTTY